VGAVGSVLESTATLASLEHQVGRRRDDYLAGAITGSLLFGQLTDRFGRKRLFLVNSVSTSGHVADRLLLELSLLWPPFGFSPAPPSVASTRRSTPPSTSSSPPACGGSLTLAINGSYWIGTALGASVSMLFLDPRWVSPRLGWRLAFGLGGGIELGGGVHAGTGCRRARGGSFCTAGPARPASSSRRGAKGSARARPPRQRGGTMRLRPGKHLGYVDALRVVFRRYRDRAVLCLVLMVAQAFFYNSVFFTYALILTRFFGVHAERVGMYLIPLPSRTSSGRSCWGVSSIPSGASR